MFDEFGNPLPEENFWACLIPLIALALPIVSAILVNKFLT